MLLLSLADKAFYQVEIQRNHPNIASLLFDKRSEDNIFPKFKCDRCVYSTNIATNFRNHQRTHSGDKPFKCTHCHRAFTTKQNLKKHAVVHGIEIKNDPSLFSSSSNFV